MPTPIDPKRLPRLRAALKKVKPGEHLPQQEIARIYGVTNARFTTLAHDRFENFPTPERRADKAHWYDAKTAIESMIAYAEGQSKRKSASAARVAHMFNGGETPVETGTGKSKSVPAGEEKPEEILPTPADLDRIANAELRTFRLQQEKSQYVHVSQFKLVVQGIVARVQRTFSGLASEIDPHGELDPERRAKLEKAIKQSQLKLHDSVVQYLEADANA